MMLKLQLATMRDAEALSESARACPCAPILRAGPYCVSAAATLGVLCLLYGEERPLLLDASALPAKDRAALEKALREKGLLEG